MKAVAKNLEYSAIVHFLCKIYAFLCFIVRLRHSCYGYSYNVQVSTWFHWLGYRIYHPTLLTKTEPYQWRRDCFRSNNTKTLYCYPKVSQKSKASKLICLVPLCWPLIRTLVSTVHRPHLGRRLCLDLIAFQTINESTWLPRQWDLLSRLSYEARHFIPCFRTYWQPPALCISFP